MNSRFARLGMSIGIIFLIALVTGLTLTAAQGIARRGEAALAVGTAFSYQGRLDHTGAPSNGSFDFTFALYDAPVSGGQVGTPITQTLPVTNGIFTTALDFGSNAFDGSPRYLEIHVQPSGGGGFTALAPRQALNPVPYAIFADQAPWSGLSGMPAGFADGVDNTDSPYAHIIVVAKSGGDYSSVNSAVSGITDAGSSNPYLVWIAPGIYTESVTMKPYVDIEGSGEGVTKITSGGGGNTINSGTVEGADNAELRYLSVENFGGSQTAVAIFNDAASPVLRDVRVTASGSLVNHGIYNANGAAPEIRNVKIEVSGGNASYGIRNETGASPDLDHVNARTAGAINNFAVFNNNASAGVLNSILSGDQYGIYNTSIGGTFTVTVYTSQVGGMTSSIRNFPTFSTRVGASLLEGGPADTGGGTLTCADSHDEAGRELGGDCQGTAGTNTLLVAKSGGDFSSISAALSSITDAGPNNPYLVRIAPGIYTETVTMKAFVDIEGAGEGVTRIVDTGTGVVVNTGTVEGADNAELRFLTVENIGGSQNAVAIYNDAASPRLTNVTAIAAGGTVNHGVYNKNGSAPRLANMTIDVSGGNASYGVRNESGSFPSLRNVSVKASGGLTNYGMYNNISSTEIVNSLIAGDEYGIYNNGAGGPYTVTLNISQVSGTTSTIQNFPTFTVYVGVSLLDGGVVAGGGTFACAGAYDGTYSALNAVCQ